MEAEVIKKTSKDKQMSGLAAEFFVAAELLKRDIQTSMTFGNAKAIDLMAVNSKSGKTFSVQVKALRSKNYFLLQPEKVRPDHIYAFVLLNKPGEPVIYFIVPGFKLLSEPLRFDKCFIPDSPMSGIYWNSPALATFKDNWGILGSI